MRARQAETGIGRGDWCCLPWWKKAVRCCSRPILFYTFTYGLIGGLFLIGARFLDPAMRPVGWMLVGVAPLIFGTHLVLAYRTFGRSRDPDCAGRTPRA